MLILYFRAIINHFNPKIESYAAVNHISQLSEEQVSHCSPQNDLAGGKDQEALSSNGTLLLSFEQRKG